MARESKILEEGHGRHVQGCGTYAYKYRNDEKEHMESITKLRSTEKEGNKGQQKYRNGIGG